MHFKGKIWDFYRKFSQGEVLSPGRVIWVSCKDSYSLRLAQKILVSEREAQYLEGQDTSYEKLQRLTQNDLFGKISHYVVSSPPKDCSERLLQESWQVNPQQWFLFLGSFGLKKKNSLGAGQVFLEITSPDFWEGEKLLNFTASLFKISFNRQASTLFLQRTPLSFSEFYQRIKKFKQEGVREEELGEKIKTLFPLKRIDHFHYIDLLTNKSFKECFQSLREIDVPLSDWIHFFYFVQGHFIKVATWKTEDFSGRLSRYQQKILNAQNHWNDRDIQHILHLVRELEKTGKTSLKALKNKLEHLALVG